MTNWTSHSAVTTTAGNHELPTTTTPFTRLRPTVSLDAGPIVIPMLSAMFGFPVFALALICCLRYRARRARLRSHLKRARNSPSVMFRRATCHGGNRKHNFHSARLKVLREPPTFTELSVIGSHAQSSNSDEDARATNGNASCNAHSSRSPSLTPSPSPSPKRMSNGNIRLAFQTSPLEILTGTSGLEFTYTVVEQC